MWLDVIIEQKNKLGMSAKEIARKTKMGLSERTVTRILNRESKCPGIASVLDVGEALGLSPLDIFADSTTVLSDRTAAELQKKVDELREERDRLLADNAVLSERVNVLTDKVDTLKDEVIEVHRYYMKRQI